MIRCDTASSDMKLPRFSQGAQYDLKKWTFGDVQKVQLTF